MDCEARILVTADGVWRGEKHLALKSICDQAMEKCSKNGHNVEHCFVVSHLNRVTSPSGSNHYQNKVRIKKISIQKKARIKKLSIQNKARIKKFPYKTFVQLFKQIIF